MERVGDRLKPARFRRRAFAISQGVIAGQALGTGHPMHSVYVSGSPAPSAIPIWFVTKATETSVREHLDPLASAFAANAGFEPAAGRHLLLPGTDGKLAGVLFALEAADEGK
jgi:hypothetical protein